MINYNGQFALNLESRIFRRKSAFLGGVRNESGKRDQTTEDRRYVGAGGALIKPRAIPFAVNLESRIFRRKSAFLDYQGSRKKQQNRAILKFEKNSRKVLHGKNAIFSESYPPHFFAKCSKKEHLEQKRTFFWPRRGQKIFSQKEHFLSQIEHSFNQKRTLFWPN